MTCHEFVELVTAYVEGALSDDERAAFEAHVDLCDGCARYLDQLRQTIHLLGELPEETLSAPARRHLLAAFADWRTNLPPTSA